MTIPITPGIRGIQHIGLTVPNAQIAAQFFIDVLGCTELFVVGPFDVDATRAIRYDVAPGCTLERLIMLACKSGPNLELFEYRSTGTRFAPPRNNEPGGHHVAFQVDDLAAAAQAVAIAGGQPCGQPNEVLAGPFAGLRWLYVKTPWASYIEFVEFPSGGISAELGADAKKLFRP